MKQLASTLRLPFELLVLGAIGLYYVSSLAGWSFFLLIKTGLIFTLALTGVFMFFFTLLAFITWISTSDTEV